MVFLKHVSCAISPGYRMPTAHNLTLYSLSSWFLLFAVHVLENAKYNISQLALPNVDYRCPATQVAIQEYVLVHCFKCSAFGFRNKIECPNQWQQTEDGEEGIGSANGISTASIQCGYFQMHPDPNPVLITRGGVMRPMMKLLSQFEQVANATPFALREDGNISEGTAQGTGPHEAPKLSM